MVLPGTALQMGDAQSENELDGTLEDGIQFGDIVISQIMREDQQCQQQQGMTYEKKPAEGAAACSAAASFPGVEVLEVSNIVSSLGEHGTSQDTATAVATTSRGSQQVQNDELSEGQIMDCSLLVDEHEIDCFDDFNEGQGIDHFDDQNSQSYSIGRLTREQHL